MAPDAVAALLWAILCAASGSSAIAATTTATAAQPASAIGAPGPSDSAGGGRAEREPQTPCAFSVAVSDIVPSYIERGFDLTATHRTTEEFLRDLLELPNAALARHRALLSDFVHQCG